MKLKIPPALVLLCFALLMYLLAKFLPVGNFDFFGRRYLIMALFAMAVIILLISFYQFYRAKTTIDPGSPSKASKLLTNGIYKFSRNPIYLAMLLILLAFGLKLGNAFNSLTAALFVAYMNRFQILPEEEVLSSLFGKEYQYYCAQVRRWF
ncbi:methyltransferase family protein [Muriicola sp. Z0-33]|uniref:methyltransferase family protein n=1 Tax=Muriicola sp. Z0-33 TaxID=2816957 RepID=UPI002238AC41|nr:isoprenylcysteine carboxylmethyltransferase family protein [Muriicola sp. Z0-33]MCW5517100.1 isoprenylcysteine carboxylmethyltransferase family protein [Muriicola sp. Z0-33]